MLQLSEDENFHYEIVRSLGICRYAGGDIAETLSILPKIAPGNFEDWYREWHNLGLRVLSTLDESKLNSYSPVTLRDIYFRASHYFFVADFFLHGNPSDPRIGESVELWRKYFDKANALLPIPGKHASIPTNHGFSVPIIVYRTPQASAANPRPTLIVGGGFDSNMEEIYHVFGIPALERGYNVIIYEGPGQRRVLHEQQVGWIYDWEKAVTPIVDYVFSHKGGELAYIDTAKIGLIGYSLGGYLCARAAAFEPRLAAVICVDGVLSFTEALWAAFPELKAAYDQGDENVLNQVFDSVSPSSSTNKRWFHDHLGFSCRMTKLSDMLKLTMKMDLTGHLDKIKCPAFVGEAEADIFFLGQPAKVAKGIGSKAKLVPFTSDQSAQLHCQSGALVYLNQEVLEWFGEVVGDKK